jgi:cytochrome c
VTFVIVVLDVMHIHRLRDAGQAADVAGEAPERRIVNDAVSGKAIFQHICQNCHSAEIGINKVGPSLWNIVGREPASAPDYTYSEAMRTNKTAWSVPALDAFLADPRGDVHGAKMFFKGLPESKDRADVIAYLATLK